MAAPALPRVLITKGPGGRTTRHLCPYTRMSITTAYLKDMNKPSQRLNLVIFVPLKASHPIIFHQKYRGQGYDLISDGCWKFLLSCGRSIRLTGNASLRKIELQSPSVTEVLLE